MSPALQAGFMLEPPRKPKETLEIQGHFSLRKAETVLIMKHLSMLIKLYKKKKREREKIFTPTPIRFKERPSENAHSDSHLLVVPLLRLVVL